MKNDNITKLLQMLDTNNPLYKVMTDNLQLVLTNVLIRSILNSTRLRCGGISND